jgi:SAM-dependent methyltransferase
MSLREAIYRARYSLSILEFRALALRVFRCPLCGGRLLVRISFNELGVRCLGCAASAITLSMVSALCAVRPQFRREKVYELSSRGPLFKFLRQEVVDLTVSEYFDDVLPGEFRNGVQCQDVQHLTFPNAQFDLVTSSEVFEHVADDRQGFFEIRRVLRPGGAFVFTVPIEDADVTIERAELRDNRIEHLLPPAYHDDHIRGRGQVLVFRDYGRDVVDRLTEAGFQSARIENGFKKAFLGMGRQVVIASA